MIRPPAFATLMPFLGHMFGHKAAEDAAERKGIPVQKTELYLREIRSIVGEGNVCHSCTATLQPLGDKAGAVRVVINGVTVGFLAPADAPRFMAKYRNSRKSCRAVILEGGPDAWGLGIWLDLRL